MPRVQEPYDPDVQTFVADAILRFADRHKPIGQEVRYGNLARFSRTGRKMVEPEAIYLTFRGKEYALTIAETR